MLSPDTSSTALALYEQARQALARVRDVDEAKDIRDKAVALEAYARQAKDRELQQWAAEIRLRAERRTGQLLRAMPKHPGGNPNLCSHAQGLAKLSSMGISHHESSEWQRLATLSDDEFEQYFRSAHPDDPVRYTTKRILRAAGLMGDADHPDLADAVSAPHRSSGPPRWFAVMEEMLAKLGDSVQNEPWVGIELDAIDRVADRLERLAFDVRMKAKRPCI